LAAANLFNLAACANVDGLKEQNDGTYSVNNNMQICIVFSGILNEQIKILFKFTITIYLFF
jgi:plasmid maintenance system killer protein